MLPCAVRPQISLAYLIARAADTIADTEVIPCEHRLDLLQTLRQRIRSNDPQPLDLGALIQKQGRPSERLLLERIEEGLSHLERLSQEDQQRIRQVLDMITSGQVLDLQRFGQASASQIQSLSNDDELDDYIYV
jgi:farnesyl-diphosphate farnesyltransferase